MGVVSKVTREIFGVLPYFGLRVSKVQAGCLAAIYLGWRPHTPAETQATYLLMISGLGWLADDTLETKLLVMCTLVAHLDAQYFVTTFEHDGLSVS